MRSHKNKILLIAIAVAIVLIIGALWYASAPKQAPVSVNALDSFAKCLAQKGLVMYGAYWCPHCQNQKALFGDSFQYVNYVECTQEVQKCTAAGIEGFPTWITSDGQKLVGEQTLETLSQVSGCALSTTN